MDNPQQPSIPTSQPQAPIGQPQQPLVPPQDKPISILPVVLIFLVTFLLIVGIIASVFYFIILPKVKSGTAAKLDTYKIKTSSCQVAAYEPVTGSPFYDFVATLGPCDRDYKDQITKANDSWGKKDYVNLKSSAESAFQKSSNDFQKGVALFWIAHYNYDARDNKTAQEKLLESIKLAPNFADAFSTLTATYNELKDFQNAEIYGKKCVDLDSLYAYCHSNYGTALLANGKKDQGYKELEQAMSLQPSNQNIRDIYKSAKDFYK